MVNWYRSILIFTLLLIQAPRLWAQSSQLRAYTLTDGLPQSQVYDVVQDELGYLWMGTQGGGICRFDGMQFKTWTDQDGLSSNYINALAVASDTLYIGSVQGVTVKNRSGFRHYPCQSVNVILPIGNKVLVGTTLGLSILDQDQNKLTELSLGNNIDLQRINDVQYDGKHFWLATSRGLWRLSSLEDNRDQLQISRDNFQSITFRDSSIYAATFQNGVLKVDRRDGNILQALIGPSRINHIAFLSEDQLWVSTDNAGIFIYQADDLSFIRKIDREAGLSVYHIRKCFQDRQSNIWIATSGGGIYKYAPSNFRHFDRETGLKGNRVYAVLQAGQSIIASNSEAGLVRIDTLGVRDTLDDARLLNVKIKALAEDTDGNTWIGTEGRGLFLAGISRRDSIVIDTSSQPVRIDTFHLQKPFVRILDESVGFHGRWIRKIVLNQDEVWIGTYSAGIYRFRYDVDDDRLYELKHFGRSEGINELLINDMLADTLGRIWYGTKKGHLGYIEKDKVHHLGNVLEQNTDIVSLCIKGEQLYLGTAGRGIWFSELYDTQDFVQLQGIKELTSNNIYQLIFDADGNLWAGTERGVDKIILNNVEQIQDLFHYNRNDGFLGIETCQNAAIRDRNDNLWFGTIYGLTRYQPLENKRVNIKPALAFESIEIFYEELDSVDPKLWFEQGRTLQLAPRENHLAFRYRTVDINNPEEIQYRWRLNQAPWSPWLEDNAINFAGLSYGDYLFEAQSRNEGWEESDVIGFRFNIARPLYEEPWFQRTVIGVIVLIIAGLIWRYIRRWKARNEAERSRLEMENHLLSLEQKALRLQMNPHFVFNVLNGIKAMSGGDTEKMHLTINKFATLLRAILNNSRQDHITLAQEVDTLRNYIEVEQLMATQPFNYEIEIEDSLDTEEILIPPMLIQPFVENAIRHGIMAVQREGELRIRFWQKDHYLYCAVTDNGIGINASRNGKKNTSHQSVALEVTRERIESLSGKESLQIEELIDPDGKVAGTKASFRLPVMTDY